MQVGGLVKEVPSSCSRGVPKLLAGRASRWCARTVDSAHQAIQEASAGLHLLSFPSNPPREEEVRIPTGYSPGST